jgi:hypothetical protein
MTPEDFVRNFKIEKDLLLKSYVSNPPKTAVGGYIQTLNLSLEQTNIMSSLLDQALTDAFYTILLGLDGCCSIGNAMQQNYHIQSEDGSDISCGGGEIEALAYAHFQKAV